MIIQRLRLGKHTTLNQYWLGVDHRLRRLSNIKPELHQRRVFAGLALHWVIIEHKTLNHCCFNAGPTSATLAQHWNQSGCTCCVCWVLRAESGVGVYM